MGKLSKSIIAVLIGVLGFALNRYVGLPGSGPLISLVIVYISFINGLKTGVWFSIFVLIIEILLFNYSTTTHIQYRITMLILSQPLMAILVGNLKNSHLKQEKAITTYLTYKADTYRRYFDGVMAAVPLIANYPAVSIIDREGNYVATNEEFTYVTGYTEDEVVGKKWYLAINRQDLDKAQAAYEEMIKTGISKATRYGGLTKDSIDYTKEVVLIMCRDREGRFVGHLKLERKVDN